MGKTGGFMRFHDVEAVYPFLPGMKEYLRGTGDRIWFAVSLMAIYKKVDVDQLKERFQELVSKRQMLRAAPVYPDGGEPMIVVRKNVKGCLFTMDLRWAKGNWEKQKQHIRSFVNAFRLEGFPRGEPAFRAGLIRVGDNRWSLLLLSSHYLLDGAGVQRVADDLLSQDTLITDAEEVSRYYSGWARLSSAPETKAYWRNLLSGQDGYTKLPILKGDGSGEGVKTGEISFPREPVSAYCRKHRVSSSAVIHAAMGMTLISLTGQDRVCFATTTDGRSDSLTRDKRLTGMFANDLPFIYQKGDTPKDCMRQLLSGREYGMIDAASFGARYGGLGTSPWTVHLSINSFQLARGTMPDNALLDDLLKDSQYEEIKRLEVYFVLGDAIYLHDTYAEKCICSQAVHQFEKCFLENLTCITSAP